MVWHLDAHVSLRGVVIVLLSLLALFTLLGCGRPTRLPCPQTVRLWLLRVGLFLLRRGAARRCDWVWIVDHTIRIGQHKCLLILGVSLQRLRNGHGALEHRDVVVLDLQVSVCCTGESVAARFRVLAQRTGVPAQIVSDHGADLAKAVRLFKAENPEVVDTYDVTHKLACLTQHHLEADPRWAELLRQFTKSLFVLQQSAAAFLLPAVARQRARYLNVSRPIEWAQRMLKLLRSADLGEVPSLLTKSQPQAREFLEENWAGCAASSRNCSTTAGCGKCWSRRSRRSSRAGWARRRRIGSGRSCRWKPGRTSGWAAS